ncbi:MAG: hypothetical protein M5U26_06580 [Planctomycetota bacterium]|nr:hypothetical protein [Planctomycetota bacterium]
MHYHVKAKPIDAKAAEFHRILTDGTVAKQQPDGAEIVASMARAVLADDGYAYWTETCYCATPLHHERATVYDRFFTEFEATERDEALEVAGQYLMDVLSSIGQRQ